MRESLGKLLGTAVTVTEGGQPLQGMCGHLRVRALLEGCSHSRWVSLKPVGVLVF